MEKIVSGMEIVEGIREHYELAMLPRETGSTAKSYRFAEGEGKSV